MPYIHFSILEPCSAPPASSRYSDIVSSPTLQMYWLRANSKIAMRRGPIINMGLFVRQLRLMFEWTSRFNFQGHHFIPPNSQPFPDLRVELHIMENLQEDVMQLARRCISLCTSNSSEEGR